MELTFVENDETKRVLYLYDTFGPPDALPRGMRESPMLFGESFYKISKLNKKIRTLPRGYESVFKYLFKERQNEIELSDCKEIIQQTQFIPISEDDTWSELATKFKESVKGFFSNKSTEIAEQLKAMFGFDLPKSIVIALAQNFEPRSGSGSRIYYSETEDKCYISYRLGKEQDFGICIGIILHELIHCLIQKYAIVDKQNDKDYFEEALLDYFVPTGLLAADLGLTKKKDARYYHICNTTKRRYSAEMSARLLPFIDEYCKNRQGQNIWQFLEKRGFDSYMQ